MKNNIEKIVHNCSSNIVRIGCLSLILIGTSECLMQTGKEKEIEIENTAYAADQQVEFPLPVLKKVLKCLDINTFH